MGKDVRATYKPNKTAQDRIDRICEQFPQLHNSVSAVINWALLILEQAIETSDELVNEVTQ